MPDRRVRLERCSLDLFGRAILDAAATACCRAHRELSSLVMATNVSTRDTADAVVIGGGIVGAMCALHLSRAGLSVVLVERDGVACGTSGSCMGHLMVVPKPPALARLTYRSVLSWHRLAEEFDGFEHNPCGALWLAESDADLELLDRLETMLSSLGATGTRLNGDDLHRFEPGLARDLRAGYHCVADGVVMPMLAAGAVLREAVGRGAEVRPGTEVVGLRVDAGGAVEAVVTARGEIATRLVVIAAGVWAPDVLERGRLSRVPIFPRRGDLAITMPREVPVRHQLLEVGYLRTTGGEPPDPTGERPDSGANALNVQPQSHGTCLIGSTRQFAGYGRTVEPALLQRSLRRAVRFVPGLAGARLTRTWAGLRPFTPDGMPLVGPTVRAAGVLLAAGHEGLGITLAPITGEIIAALATGTQPPVEIDGLAPDRFG